MTTEIKFKRVILYARQWRANQDVNETLHQVATFLKQQGVDAYLDVDTALFFESDLSVLPRTAWRRSDLMIVVGGDGSLLSAAHAAVHQDMPVIGINRGYLGFLTDLSSNEFESRLLDVLHGLCVEEPRALLRTAVYEKNQWNDTGDALNDVVLSRGNETRLISFDVLVNGLFVSHYRADGLIVSTPTGSTAYALSAGGPILHPALDAMALVPMFSHSLSSRPLVIDGQSVVEIQISESNEHALQMSCDGLDAKVIYPGQRITVQKSPRILRLLHPRDYHYFDTLRFKLGWGSAG